MVEPVKTALIGYGHLGKYHAQKCAVLNTCDFMAIVDHNSQARERAQKDYPQIQVAANWDEVAQKVEALIIVTPTSSHYQLVEQALGQSKHVFCEKTLCSSYSEAQKLCQFAKESPKQVIQVGHSERFHKAWGLMRHFPDHPQGAIRMDRLAPFKGRATDVDVVQDLMAHDLDLLLHVLKERPVEIRAQGFKIRTKQWDHVNCQLVLASGRMAHISVGRSHVVEKRKMEIVNPLGCLVVDLCRHEVSTSVASSSDQEVEVISYQQCDHLLEQQREFYHCIRSGEGPRVSIEQARDVIFNLDKVLHALESGQTIQL